MKKNEIIFAIGVNYSTVDHGDDPSDAVGYGEGTIRDICLMSFGNNLEDCESAGEGMEFFLEYSGIEEAAQKLKSGVYRATFNLVPTGEFEEEFRNIKFEPLYVLAAGESDED